MRILVLAAVVLAYQVNFNPDPSQIPGVGTFTDITNGIGAYAIQFCLLIGVAGVMLAIIGRVSHNAIVNFTAFGAMGLAAIGGFVIGALPRIVNWAVSAGIGIH
jgi:hypothetical protein